MWSASYHVTEETSRFIISTGERIGFLMMFLGRTIRQYVATVE
jgi:hypothetical protein